MKIVRHLFSGLMLFAGLTGGFFASADAQPVVSPVTSEVIKCDKALLERDGNELIARFLVQNKPEYNSYRGVVAGHVLDSSNTDLKMVSSQLATWLIFIDISDPSGRKKIIANSAAVTARLVSLMSPDSEVHVVVAAGSQQVVARTDELQGLMTEGRDLVDVFHHSKYSFLQDRICNAKGIQNNNTHIWVGLTRAIKDEMPNNVEDIKRYQPRGVILISDGMDESDSTDEDFQMLVKTAKEMNIPVHTIAVPYKDSASKKSSGKKGNKGGSDTAIHKGYAAMQRLAVQTNGSYLTYEDVLDPNEPYSIKLLNGMLRKTSAMLLQLKTSLTDNAGNIIIPSGRSLKLILTEGREKTVGYMELPQEQLGLIVGDYALECLLKLRNGCNENNIEQTKEKMIKIFKESLLPLSATDELFECSYVDRDYALRVRKLLQHVKNTPGVLSKPGVESEIVLCLLDLNAPLPEAPKEDTNVNVNNNIPVQGGAVTINGTTAGGAAEEEGDTPKLVWWVVGIGGAFACIIVFIVIVRSLTRSDDDEAVVRGPRPDSGAAPVPTPPLATLDDAKQPGQSWAVRKTSVSVGRSASADVRLPSGHVSNIHFTLYREATGQWMVKDANSTNGTIVNGSKISTATVLNSGDIISVADMQLVFRIK